MVVFAANPRKNLNRVFAFYSICIATWSLAEGFLINASNKTSAEFWTTLEWAGVSFIAPSFLHTVILLTGEARRKSWSILLLGYCLGAIFLLLHLFTDAVTLPSRPVAYLPYFGNIATLGYYLPITFFILVNLGLFKLWSAYRASTERKRNHFKFLFWTSLVGYLGGSFDWALTFGFYIPGFNPFGMYAIPLYSAATTYAILQHSLFDISLVIRRSLVYSILVTSLTISYFGLAYGLNV